MWMLETVVQETSIKNMDSPTARKICKANTASHLYILEVIIYHTAREALRHLYKSSHYLENTDGFIWKPHMFMRNNKIHCQQNTWFTV